MADPVPPSRVIENPKGLRQGWTTGACATAATKSALSALLGGAFEDPVTITLPKGQIPSFAIDYKKQSAHFVEAGIIKDAGDDPDVTHGAMIVARVSRAKNGAGVVFKAGLGVGTITRPGLPLPVGEAAINPAPRALMRAEIETLCKRHMCAADIEVEISVPTGADLAKHTWNPRLGIVGGISILGTTGIVHPFSCSAWIHSIHRGIDVARANGLDHVAGCTGSTSEGAVQHYFQLPDHAMLDMGDFAGGVLKYLRHHPVPRLTLGGGFAKLTKLAQGSLDLHSARSKVDLDWLAKHASRLGSSILETAIKQSNSAAHARTIMLDEGVDLAPLIAHYARKVALSVVSGTSINIDVMVVDREGIIIAHDDGT